ncbi:MAG: lamin tail domain-containing protein, partial [Thermoguttaceae bacterium]
MLHNLRGKLIAVPNRLFRGKRSDSKAGCGHTEKRGPTEKLSFEPLEQRLALNVGPLVISEFLADNETGILDENNDRPDWIEIHNPTTSTVSLNGWYLTDDATNLMMWDFPDILVEPGGYQVVFASNKDRRDAAGELHTNFKLTRSGEYLGLIQPDGLTVAHDFSPQYPPQYEDIAYGMGQDITPFVLEGSDFSYRIPTVDDTPLEWTEVGYDDSSWDVNGAGPTLLITEAGTGSPDYVEIQNVSDSVLDTRGWVVAFNVGTTQDINNTQDKYWELPDSIAPGEVLYKTDDLYPPLEEPLGFNVYWSTSAKGWAMIVDNFGNVVDFLPWMYPADQIAGMNTVVNGFPVRGSSAWSGNGVATAAMPAFHRVGSLDSDDASDFVNANQNDRGSQNPGLVLPVVSGGIRGAGYSMLPGGFGGSIQTDVGSQMHDTNASLWMRTTFEIDDLAQFDAMQLRMKYNDGFVAYLNGEEMTRRNAAEPPLWNSSAPAARTVGESVEAEAINVSASIDLLQPGTNVLSVHGMNVAAADADFLIIPELLAAQNLGTLRFMATPTPGEANEDPMVAERPVFSKPLGMFTEPFELVLSLPPETLNGEVRYTLDGSNPTADSTVYTDPIPIDATTEIRAKIFEPGVEPGPIAIGAYVKLAANMQTFTSDLPIIIIENFGAGDIPPSSSSNMQDGFMTIFEPDEANGLSSPANVPDLQTQIGMRKRGSSSGGWAKNHFAIEARDEFGEDRDIEPLGLPSESDWILLSFYQFDRAMMRNPLIYELSNQAGRYAVRTRYVEVFFNKSGGDLAYADYFGVYALTEKIKLGPDRVDVPQLEKTNNMEPEVSGGYVFKIDRNDPGEGSFNAGGLTLHYVEPKQVEVTAAQNSYVVNYFNQAKAALDGPNFTDPELGYAPYVDVGAWIDHHWLNLLALNPDAFRLSGYLFKDRGEPISAGPAWDFDRTMESTDGRDNDPYAWQAGNNAFFHYGWYDRLFQDPNFTQANVDRWYELREDVFSMENISAIINSYADQMRQAAVRNFQKWTANPPRFGSWQSEVNYLENWLRLRTTWIDTQFQPIPRIKNQADQPITALHQTTALFEIATPFNLTLDSRRGTVYYTLDGTDPRAFGGGVADGAIEYVPDTLISLTDSTLVTARTFVTGNYLAPFTNWSAPLKAEFLAHAPASAANLAITELAYHPYPPLPGEGEVGEFADDDFEFIELMNTGDEIIDLAGVTFTDGVDVRLTVSTLAPGERSVVVEDIDAFEARYGSQAKASIKIAGRYKGNLDNDGERIEIVDRFGQLILDLTYNDSGRWPGRADGNGASLLVVDLAGDLNDGANWNSSVEFGGSPGETEKARVGGVVINEVLTHTPDPALDAIELYNPTAADIDIGGWYLSDSSLDFLKFRIPDGTQILSGRYIVFDEDDFNTSRGALPQDRDPKDFALDGAHGDDVWLWQSDETNEPTDFVNHIEFNAALAGETLGRWPTAEDDVYPMQSDTLGDVNSGPRAGSVIISEVHYHPVGASDENREFIEIYNTTDQLVDLTEWRIRGGIDFYFKAGTTIGPKSVLVVVPFDPESPDGADAAKLADFLATYSIDASV